MAEHGAGHIFARSGMNQMDITQRIAAEAAPGIEVIDAKPINRKAERQLYARRQKIHPKLVHGKFRRAKWLLMTATLAIYYVLPWLRWPRGASLPDQAFLIDAEHGRLFFFFLEIWPQELYFVTGLLVISALSLFLVTSAAGRVWCGYSCPQTVWTDLMVSVERFWQGDRNARIRLDRQAWGAVKIFKKVMTHACWLLIAVATGGAFVLYFRDAPTLTHEFATGTAPAIAYLFVGIFTFTTYLLGGIAREQVCIYMCPWPRIQGAMVDRHTLLVSYRPERGEPRGPLRKSQGWEGRGDCIDCKACVAACPMGIDIRDGSQLECIQCALCIDACNEIMDKVERPRGLICYDTIAKQEAKQSGLHESIQLVRPRTVLYAAVIAVVGAVMLFGAFNRTALQINVLHDRSVLFVPLSNGGVRNGYTVKILNKRHEPRNVALSLEGLSGASLTVLGMESAQRPRITIPTDNLVEARVFVTVPPDGLARLMAPQTPLSLVVKDEMDGTVTRRTTMFISAP
jgi:cytochrome c oxidase accessory protein FixG